MKKTLRQEGSSCIRVTGFYIISNNYQAGKRNQTQVSLDKPVYFAAGLLFEKSLHLLRNTDSKVDLFAGDVVHICVTHHKKEKVSSSSDRSKHSFYFSSFPHRLISLPSIVVWPDKMNLQPFLTISTNQDVSSCQLFPHWLKHSQSRQTTTLPSQSHLAYPISYKSGGKKWKPQRPKKDRPKADGVRYGFLRRSDNGRPRRKKKNLRRLRFRENQRWIRRR